MCTSVTQFYSCQDLFLRYPNGWFFSIYTLIETENVYTEQNEENFVYHTQSQFHDISSPTQKHISEINTNKVATGIDNMSVCNKSSMNKEQRSESRKLNYKNNMDSTKNRIAKETQEQRNKRLFSYRSNYKKRKMSETSEQQNKCLEKKRLAYKRRKNLSNSSFVKETTRT